MNLKCKKCGTDLYLEDIYDTDGGIDEGFIFEKRFYSCENCEQEYIVGINKKIEPITEDDIAWFKES